MAEVIYRKYRPRSFADIVGQDNVINLLKTSVANGELSHAYLFSGPRGTGKTSTARILAKAVSCLNFAAHNDVCNECEVCVAINNGTHMDLIEIDAASNRGIEEIRQLKDNINFLPSVGKYKIYIIDEVHMLTKEAFNALLKTLEEPPAHVIFVLATTEPHKIPLTVLSRLQKYTFKLAAPEDVISKLRGIAAAESLNIADDALAMVAEMSEGGFRDAESMLGKIMAMQQGKVAITSNALVGMLGIPETSSLQGFTDILKAKDAKQAVTYIDDLYMRGLDLHQFQDRLVSYLSKEINKALLQGAVLNAELNILQTLLKLQNDYQSIDNPKLNLQLLILRICEPAGAVSSPKPPAQPPVALPERKQQPERVVDQVPAPSVNKVVEHPILAVPITESEPQENIKEGQWEALLTQARKINLQLWLILKISRLDWQDNLPVVVVGHSAHLETLNSEKLHAKLQTLLQKIYAIDTEVKYVLDQNIALTVNEPSQVDGPKLSSDNSQLVESIF